MDAGAYISKVFLDSGKGVARLDADFRITWADDAFLRITTQEANAATGSRIQDVFFGDEADDMFMPYFETGRFTRYQNYTLLIRREEGKHSYIDVQHFPVEEDEAYLVLTDLSEGFERKDYRTREIYRSDVLLDISSALFLECSNFTGLLDVLVKKCSHYLGGSCVIHILKPGADTIEHVAIRHGDPRTEAKIRALLGAAGWNTDSSLPREVVYGSSSLVIPRTGDKNLELLGTRNYIEMLRILEAKSMIIAPMLAGGRTVGTVTLSSSDERHRYTTVDKAFVQQIATLGALAIRNVRITQAQATR